MTTNNNTTRRQWFRRTARYGLFATLAATAAALLRRRDNANEAPCIDPKGRLGCRNCNQISGCGLPRALSFKRYLEREHGDQS